MKNIAVITGASSGIGKEFTRQISDNGDIDEIWIIARDDKRLYEVKNEINKNIKVLALDLTCQSELDRYKEELELNKPNIKILVNCAGFGKFDHEENIDTNIKLNMIDLNVKAVVNMTDYSLPYMVEGASIINVSSNAAFQPVPYINIYAATKSFVLSYSRALNVELKYRKIKVLAVCPFWTKTDFFDRAIDEDKKNVVINYIAMYEPEDVVRKALRDLYHSNKDVSIYGFKNKLQIMATALVPHRFVMKIWMKQQKLDGTPKIRG